MPFHPVPDLWVVEFSRSQGAFNVQLLSETVRTNHRMFFESRTDGYQVVAVTRTLEEARIVGDILNSRPDRSFNFGLEESVELAEELAALGMHNFLPPSDPSSLDPP